MSTSYDRIHKEFSKQLNRNLTLVFGSTAIALHRYWGWGKKRINDVLEEIMNEWVNENAEGENYSMMKMLDDEADIDMQLEGKSWRDVDFLNGITRTTDRVDRMSTQEYLYMMHQKIKWQPMQLTASVLLALYRTHGFSTERDIRLMDQMAQIQEEFGMKPQKIINAVKTETGMDLWVTNDGRSKATV